MSVVGIDLGTTNTVVAAVRAGKVHVLADEKGARLLPSVVSFHPNGDVLVGGAAKARRVIDARNTVYSHKRLIGRSWGSPEIVQAKQRFPFELREGPGQGPLVHARNQDYTLPEISAFVLKRSRQIAEAALGQPVERAVITVPAHFNELQRASTKVAGRVSGLEVLRILNEPTAAALAYGLGRTGSERVAVYDFGGGTFDCTLLDLNGNVFEVLATAGDSFLGGDDVDQLIADRMAESYLKQYRQDVRSDPQAYERLKTTAEEIKIALSTAETHTVVMKELAHGMGGSSINYTFTMTRRDLEAAMTPLVDRTFKVTQDALTLARLSPTSFDKVILVGGSTRAPLVRKRVEAFFGSQPMDRVNPDEVVAIGAAIQAAALTEGQKRRSIPAPPGRGAMKPQVDKQEFTQTSELDPSMLKPAFASEPPAFGFASTVGSQAPPGHLGFASTVGSNAPPVQARPGQGPGLGGPANQRRTNPGLAPPQTQPNPGGRSQAFEDDPSLQSLPDLQAPAPFEWVPQGQPSSEAADPNTVTQAAPQPGPPGGGQGRSPFASHVPDYNRIDEPPSVFATSTGRMPPHLARGGQKGSQPPPSSRRMPAASPSAPPAPPPPPAELPDGPFGAVADLSLISTTGVNTNAGVTNPGFGQIGDLSLVSTSSSTQTETGVTNEIAAARAKALAEGFVDDGRRPPETVKGIAPALGAGRTVQLEPGENPAAKKDASLVPSGRGSGEAGARDESLIDRQDLPAVVARAKPARKPGQQTVPSMGAKPPPLIAPQPFGPMEKIGDEPPPSQRPRVPPGAKQPPPAIKQSQAKIPAAKPDAPPATQAMPARTQISPPGPAPAPPVPQPKPARTVTAPPPAPPPMQAPPPVPQRPPMQETTQQFQVPPVQPPPPQQHFAPAPQPSAPPPQPYSQPPAFGGFGSGAPPNPQPFGGFGSGPPPGYPNQNPSQPPAFGGFGTAPSNPPQHQPSQQPQMFGGFNSAPPPDASVPLDFGAGAFQGAPGQDISIPPQGPTPDIQYQSPVLVDVTPRGLIVETAGGYTDIIIPRNSKIPCERTRRFATGRDMQTTVRVRVAQGEGTMFAENTFLGEVELSGLRPASRGEVTVAVTFEVDADGTLKIRARDTQTGQEARATLQLIGVADESSVVMMINRFAQQPVVGQSS
ncbi:MAG: Hsp70 family protein [Labilithrix sp.]